MDLNQLRSNIDDIDKEILALFMKRMELCKGVADYKKANNLPVFQGGREQQVIDRIKALTNDKELESGTAALFTTIMDISKILQNRKLLSDESSTEYTAPDFANAKKVGCQGTSGANSETATHLIFGDKEITFYKTFEDVFRAVQSGEIDYGVLPVHNSTAGSVNSTYDLMAKYSVYTVKEVCVEINHCLAVKNDISVDDIDVVYSHPQAISQCCDFLTSHRLKTCEYGNTATAAEMVAESSENIGAICSVECAEKLGLHIIAKNISDCSVNRTRFICISRDMQVEPDADSISVMIKIPDTEGSLYRLLTKFYVNGMNLQKIESRPLKDGSFNVMFYLDFDGRIDNPAVKALMNDLAENVEYFRFLGTFKNI
ncbi:MAG: chorismate mutase [Ruminococcus flavefaciens]|nr:chorismate mutase [Ruminococcus flavefaciens]MCM1229427.1 chorismate mutase [Ruminococcus flavefaciens]